MKSPSDVARLLANSRARGSKASLSLKNEAWYAQAHDRYSIVQSRAQVSVSLREIYSQTNIIKKT